MNLKQQSLFLVHEKKVLASLETVEATQHLSFVSFFPLSVCIRKKVFCNKFITKMTDGKLNNSYDFQLLDLEYCELKFLNPQNDVFFLF